jgi:hypothetical protein
LNRSATFRFSHRKLAWLPSPASASPACTRAKDHFIASFALHRWLENPRIVKTVDYGPRWRGHFVRITSAVDLDGELHAWLQESHDVVGMQSDLTERRVGQAKTRRRR